MPEGLDSGFGAPGFARAIADRDRRRVIALRNMQAIEDRLNQRGLDLQNADPTEMAMGFAGGGITKILRSNMLGRPSVASPAATVSGQSVLKESKSGVNFHLENTKQAIEASANRNLSRQELSVSLSKKQGLQKTALGNLGFSEATADNIARELSGKAVGRVARAAAMSARSGAKIVDRGDKFLLARDDKILGIMNTRKTKISGGKERIVSRISDSEGKVVEVFGLSDGLAKLLNLSGKKSGKPAPNNPGFAPHRINDKIVENLQKKGFSREEAIAILNRPKLDK